MKLAQKRIIITGASSGIGRTLAESLAEKGARLVLAARRQDALDETVAACRQRGGEAHAVACDVAVPDACQSLVDTAVATLGGLDVLVNNAGISMWARFDEVTDLAMFEQMMRVNYLGSVYCTHFALPHLKTARGLIVAVSSLTGLVGVPTRSGYAASKHAMQGFFDSLRVELAGSGVDVQVVSPGFVATGIRARAIGPDGKPRGHSPRKEDDARTMPVEECVRLMVAAMERRQRALVMGVPKAALLLKAIAPGVIDRITARVIKRSAH